MVFSREAYERVRAELTERFGGLTAYVRSPARGLWRDESGATIHDEIVIYEVMVEVLESEWWRVFREDLCTRFEQRDLVIRAQEIRRL